MNTNDTEFNKKEVVAEKDEMAVEYHKLYETFQKIFTQKNLIENIEKRISILEEKNNEYIKEKGKKKLPIRTVGMISLSAGAVALFALCFDSKDLLYVDIFASSLPLILASMEDYDRYKSRKRYLKNGEGIANEIENSKQQLIKEKEQLKKLEKSLEKSLETKKETNEFDEMNYARNYQQEVLENELENNYISQNIETANEYIAEDESVKKLVKKRK